MILKYREILKYNNSTHNTEYPKAEVILKYREILNITTVHTTQSTRRLR